MVSRSSAVLLAVCLVTSTARAELTTSTGILVPIEQGQAAPFSGVLLDAIASETINQQLSQAKARCKADLDLQAAVAKADAERDAAIAKARADADVRVAEANRKAAAENAKLLEARLAAAEKGRLDPALTGVLGFIAGATTTVLLVFGLR